MTIRKRFHQVWKHDCPGAILTCSILKCNDENFIVFGGHDKKLYLMDSNNEILDEISFDGWCRCSYTVDMTGDGCDEVLVGSGDGSFLVVKLDQKEKKFHGIKHYKDKEKINFCFAVDIFHIGEFQLIYGGEDNTLKIFKNIISPQPDIILYYD